MFLPWLVSLSCYYQSIITIIKKVTTKMNKHFDHDNHNCHTTFAPYEKVIPKFFCIHYANFISLNQPSSLLHQQKQHEKGSFIQDVQTSISNLTNIPFLFPYSFMHRKNNHCNIKVCHLYYYAMFLSWHQLITDFTPYVKEKHERYIFIQNMQT